MMKKQTEQGIGFSLRPRRPGAQCFSCREQIGLRVQPGRTLNRGAGCIGMLQDVDHTRILPQSRFKSVSNLKATQLAGSMLMRGRGGQPAFGRKISTRALERPSVGRTRACIMRVDKLCGYVRLSDGHNMMPPLINQFELGRQVPNNHKKRICVTCSIRIYRRDRER